MKKAVLASFGASIALTACITNPYNASGGMPPEIRAQIEQQRLAMARMRGDQPSAAAATAPIPAISEAMLTDQLTALPDPTSRPAFEKKRTGLYIDGNPLLDPEGPVTDYAYDATNGFITYFVKESDTSQLVKTTRATALDRQIVLGRATLTGGTWRFESVTGKKLAGATLLPAPRGVIIARDTSAFTWRAGENTRTVTLPENFTLAQYQNGDVGSTKFVLLEKINAEETNQVLAIFNSAKKLVGAGKKEDYALFSLDTGKIHPLNIDIESNKVTEANHCQKSKQTSWGSVSSGCQFSSRDSLYGKDGQPNRMHYYWRVHWMISGGSPVAVVQENGLKEIIGVDLASGKRVNLFSRALGIATFNVSQASDGKVAVSAQVGFSRESINDVAKEINVRPELPLSQG